MFFRKKKFYTLLDIKNQIVFTPLIFIFLLSILACICIFLFLQYEKKNKIDLLIQNENFYKSDILKTYISGIKYNSSVNFSDIENELSNHIYEIIGFLKANSKDKKEFDIQNLKLYLEDIENKKGIKFLVFNLDYRLLHGEEILNNLVELTNSENKTEKFKYYMLRNIEYIGDNNLMYSIDNQKRNIQLSYIKYITHFIICQILNFMNF